MSYLQQLNQVTLNQNTVTAAHSAAQDMAPVVLQYAEAGLKFVQIAAAVLGMVQIGAQVLSHGRNPQPVPPPVPQSPALTYAQQTSPPVAQGPSDLDILMAHVEANPIQQGPPPVMMSANGRLF